MIYLNFIEAMIFPICIGMYLISFYKNKPK